MDMFSFKKKPAGPFVSMKTMDGDGDMDEGDEGVEISMKETAPAATFVSYDGNVQTSSASCSGHRFCFLCEYMSTENPEDGDDDELCLKDDIVMCNDFIKMCALEKKSATFLVERLHRHYTNKIRPKIMGHYEEHTGKTVDKPDWTKQSILKHIMYVIFLYFSPSHPPPIHLLFVFLLIMSFFSRSSAGDQTDEFVSQSIKLMLRGLLFLANDSAIDKSTNKVDPDGAKMLFECIDRHNKHMHMQEQIKSLVGRSKSRREPSSAGKSS
jgi:hypothetical protein